tara:strand:- start:4632 stop:5321 length:690 start_codon:yes stop_codon:yes gene_type:complete
MSNFRSFYKSYINRQKKAFFNIETTHRCRLQCPFCQRQRRGGKEKVKLAGEFSYDSFRKVYDFTNCINFCGQISDPIYHTNFLKILEIKKNEYPNNKMYIKTNGSGKKLSWWEKAYDLSDKTTEWTFGLDGASQNTANIYRVGTDFDNVFKAMQLGVKMSLDIIWQFILFEHNEHELELAKKLSRNNGIVLNVIYSNRWPQEKEHLGLKKSRLQKEIPVQKYGKKYFTE